jgi:nucleoside permease NupC
MERAISALGILVFIGISYAFSVNRRAVRWRIRKFLTNNKKSIHIA